MPTLSQAEAADVGEAEAEGEEEAISVKKIGVIIVKIMDTGNVIAKRNNVTRDTIEDSSKEEEEKLKELPPELWSEGPADYIQTASFGLHLRFKDEGTPGQGYLRATKHGDKRQPVAYYSHKLDPVVCALPPCVKAVVAASEAVKASAGVPNLMIRRCTTLNPATLLPTAEEGHQHNCLDEVSTKVLPRPDLNSTPQEPIQPGDYVWVKKFVRKRLLNLLPEASSENCPWWEWKESLVKFLALVRQHFLAVCWMGGSEVPMIFSAVLTTLCRDFQSEVLQAPRAFRPYSLN
ncbi:hypothetical protein D4764_0188230 [Takifugu flavidus]|uniref:Reverse transcriptase/retrotransposon-derived protein RNase H-like domain-containing protein n=1 Tax=Takifugu flavidus TaxID=433684 RepID=A0A5C6MGN7_9TELE|nr:hypothetical protein D4764_0188230 [Takifugu flavidus]